MTTISIIGSGNMAATIGARAVGHGHTVEIVSRDPAKAQALADRIGHGTTVGVFGERPAGDIVVVAVLFAAAVEVVAAFGDALAGKILVDITNPFNADGNGLETAPGDSMADRIAAAAPEGTPVVKAFNTIFQGVLAGDRPIDVLVAGSSPEARARVGEFIGSLGLRPRDAGGIEMAHGLEWAGLVLVGLAGNGLSFDAALAVTP